MLDSLARGGKRVHRVSVAVLSVALLASRIDAQAAGRVHPEPRVDLIVSRITSMHAGASVSLPAGTYSRLTLAGGVGPAWSGESTGKGGRADAVLRFHLDPFREQSLGWYGWGGLGLLYDEFRGWRQIIVVGTGVELTRFSSRRVWALEIGVGGGLRVGLALRRIGIQRR
jgi:hypothetical protein